jgi:L-2-hydroxyglutarate oxidase LhgO
VIEKTGAAVVGAGVVGLACARALALRGIETIVLEAHGAIGTETSSRNSEVIHAGIYYSPGSLKARLCVEGKRALYEYCETRHIPHRRCGKLILARTAAEEAGLEKLRRRAEANSVHDLDPVSRTALSEMEPELCALAGLHSPSTGIVDSHALMLALLGEAESHGAVLALKSPLERAEVRHDGLLLEVGGAEPIRLHTRILVNAAGLHAARVAAAVDGLEARDIPKLRFAKGQYWSLSGRAPFSRLIYPLSGPGEFPVHIGLDLGGQARFGPSVRSTERIDYALDGEDAEAIYAGAREFWPGLPDGALQPSYCGIWPRLSGPGERPADFLLQSAAEHGVRGLVNLFGIDSPGLTACLAIADHVCGQLEL